MYKTYHLQHLNWWCADVYYLSNAWVLTFVYIMLSTNCNIGSFIKIYYIKKRKITFFSLDVGFPIHYDALKKICL